MAELKSKSVHPRLKRAADELGPAIQVVEKTLTNAKSSLVAAEASKSGSERCSQLSDRP